MKALAFVFFVALCSFSEAAKGIDVSSRVSEETWTCMKNNGHTFAIIRIYRSSGKIDANAADTIKAARAAGFPSVDGYIFPCFKCGDAHSQIQAAVRNLQRNNAQIGQIWIDIEGTQYWGPTPSANVAFIRELVEEVRAQNYSVGIYTSASQWNPITGSSTELGDIQLWYAHWDKKDNFSDFKPFGGWTSPVIKQYVGDANECGAGIDRNWKP